MKTLLTLCWHGAAQYMHQETNTDNPMIFNTNIDKNPKNTLVIIGNRTNGAIKLIVVHLVQLWHLRCN